VRDYFPLDSYDVFISHRWCSGDDKSDDRFIDLLYDGLYRDKIYLKVYLDSKRNNVGDNFQDRFMTALHRAAVIVPIVSKNVLARMQQHDPSKVDYVLLEWMSAIALIKKIAPVFLTDLAAVGKFPKVVPEATLNLMRSVLGKMGVSESSSSWSQSLTVQDIIVEHIGKGLGPECWRSGGDERKQARQATRDVIKAVRVLRGATVHQLNEVRNGNGYLLFVLVLVFNHSCCPAIRRRLPH
jgi:hypothetical protein